MFGSKHKHLLVVKNTFSFHADLQCSSTTLQVVAELVLLLLVAFTGCPISRTAFNFASLTIRKKPLGHGLLVAVVVAAAVVGTV